MKVSIFHNFNIFSALPILNIPSSLTLGGGGGRGSFKNCVCVCVCVGGGGGGGGGGGSKRVSPIPA